MGAGDLDRRPLFGSRRLLPLALCLGAVGLVVVAAGLVTGDAWVLVGAAVFLLLEELLSPYTTHWKFILGAVLLGVVLLAPNGLMSLWRKARA